MKALGAVLAGLAYVAITGAAAYGASPSAAPHDGQIRVFSNQSADSATGKILITGAIGDYGTATSIDKNGKVDPNGNFVRIALKKGSFIVDSTALNAKASKAPGIFDKSTCSFSFTASGPVTLSDGSGLYKGISGHVNITIDFAGIGPRLTSGKHKGECNPSNNAKQLDQYGAIIGTGTVKFA